MRRKIMAARIAKAPRSRNTRGYLDDLAANRRSPPRPSLNTIALM
jgi:hypothetical protein